MAHGDPIEFDVPRAGWRELWEGPVHFRATKDRSKFGPGTPLSQMEEYGRNNSDWLYRVSVDPDDGGAIVLAWQVGFPDRPPPYPTMRYYNGGPGRALNDRLDQDDEFRSQAFGHLPAEFHKRAVGAYAVSVTIREWMEREFFAAVELGECIVWARVGNKAAPFTTVPADVFIAYTITSWGFDKYGAGAASMDGAPPLYSIFLASPEASVEGSSDALSDLLAIWRSEAALEYRAKSDEVTSRFNASGRMQSGAHVRSMSEVAECVTAGLLTKARDLGVGPDRYAVAKDAALALFDELAADVGKVAVGKFGRMPQPKNAEIAARFNWEARVRIEAEVAKWSLVDSLHLASKKPDVDVISDPHSANAELGRSMREKSRIAGLASRQMSDSDRVAKVDEIMKRSPHLSKTAAFKAAAKALGGSHHTMKTAYYANKAKITG